MDMLKQLRRERGLTQAELGDLIGSSQWHISRYELGYNKPSWGKLKMLCNVLNCSASDLIGF